MDDKSVVSITSSGQLTVPADFRKKMNIKGKTKAVVELKKDHLIVKPYTSFDQLSGSLKSDIVLNDKELNEARSSFQKEWADEES